MIDFMNMSPEEIQQVMQISEMADTQQLLESKIKRLNEPSNANYSTSQGALLGGLGDIFRTIGGSVAENKASGLFKDRSKAIQALLQARARSMNPSQGPSQAVMGGGLGDILRDSQKPKNSMLDYDFLQNDPMMY